MIKRIFAMLLIISFIATSAHAFFWVRGNAWEKFSNMDKLAYVSGLMDGLLFGEECSIVKLADNVDENGYIKALDQFYDDYRNALIPVPFAFKIIKMELSGESKDLIEMHISGMRQQFSAQDQ